MLGIGGVITLLAALRYSTPFKQQIPCSFPEKWVGTWFQSGVRQPIHIEGQRLSSKGRCLRTEGDKFLLVDEKRACYRCVVIHEKHENVLQYKETFCHGRDSLPTLCSLITGDALLYSMFREDATPVACPFKGAFTFTYNRGHGECKFPPSSIDACTDDSRLLLSYQACPDVHGSESTVEELQCLAVWKEGSSRYLVGRVHHSHATSNEDRFRCFVYEKVVPGVGEGEFSDSADYRVAQSGDATCNGLFSATEGSRTMTLEKVPTVHKCRFPSWVVSYVHWHTLDYSETYTFRYRNSSKITNSSGVEKTVVCVQQLTKHFEDNPVVLVAHFTQGCSSGYACMSLYKRDIHVMEVQIGAQTKRVEDACTPMYFNKSNLPYVTLVTSSPETRACPYMGKFDVDNLLRPEWSMFNGREYPQGDRYYEQGYYIRKFTRSVHGGKNHIMRRMKRVDRYKNCDSRFTSLIIGCESVDTMEFRTECSTPDFVTAYACHGGWEEADGTRYLIAAPLPRGGGGGGAAPGIGGGGGSALARASAPRRACFAHREPAPGVVLFSAAGGASCDRVARPGLTGEMVFNLTGAGKCVEVNSSSKPKSSWLFSVIFSNVINFVILVLIQR